MTTINASKLTWRSLSHWLFEPARLTDPIQRRNGVLASSLSLGETVLLVFALLTVSYEPVLLPLIAFTLSSYLASRFGYVKIGAAMLIFGLSIWYVFYLGSLPNLNAEGARAVVSWLVLPIILASSLFSIMGVIYTGLLNIAVILAIPFIYPTLTLLDLVPVIGLPISSISLVVIAVIHRNSIERIRQQALQETLIAVRESEANLERRVIERTQELEQRSAELEIAKAEAERSNNVKSQFLAMVSHELRTPLNGIINFSAFVGEGLFGPVNSKQQEALRDVGKAGNHLLALINDVLDISKIESGSLKLFLEDNIDLQAEIQTVIKTAATLLENKPVTIQTEIATTLPTIQGDRRRIRQVLLNIMSNACKFTDTGTITVGASSQDEQVHLWIRDTGPGIAAKDHVAVFETFKQTETGLRKGGGTGLGMPISKRLVEAHGGEMWLESVLDQGTTFHVMLPRLVTVDAMPVES